MIVHRIVKSMFDHDLSGEGARLYGGRWNSKGMRALYTSQFRSLAALEQAVHIPVFMLENSYSLITIEIPDKLKIQNLMDDVIFEWNAYPLSVKTQKLGDNALLNSEIPGFKVPSALVFEEYNIILNPLHSDYAKIKIKSIRPFRFDDRLWN